MNDYQHKSLSIDEVSLLADWQVLTGESIDVTRIKLSDPAQREGFLEEIASVWQQKKATIEFLLEALSNIVKADVQGKVKEGDIYTNEEHKTWQQVLEK